MPDRVPLAHPRPLAVVAGVFGGALVGLIILVVVLIIRLSDVSYQQSVSQKASNATRVTTVTQRCGLTELMREQSVLVTHVVDLFLPKLRAPFDSLSRQYASSYAGCESQLKLVVAINAHTPKP